MKIGNVLKDWFRGERAKYSNGGELGSYYDPGLSLDSLKDTLARKIAERVYGIGNIDTGVWPLIKAEFLEEAETMINEANRRGVYLCTVRNGKFVPLL